MKYWQLQNLQTGLRVEFQIEHLFFLVQPSGHPNPSTTKKIKYVPFSKNFHFLRNMHKCNFFAIFLSSEGCYLPDVQFFPWIWVQWIRSEIKILPSVSPEVPFKRLNLELVHKWDAIGSRRGDMGLWLGPIGHNVMGIKS